MLINSIDVVCIQVVAQDIYDDTGINFFRYTLLVARMLQTRVIFSSKYCVRYCDHRMD